MGASVQKVIVLLGVLLGGCTVADSPVGDVHTYRGDAARTGVMSGPGPAAQPVVQWQAQLDGPIASSPVVAGGIVYVASGNGIVHALSLEGGYEKWRKDVGAPIGSSTPLIVGERLVVSDMGGTLRALALDDGSTSWSTSLDGPVNGSPATVDERIFVATLSGTAYAVDAIDGSIHWQRELPAGVSRSIAVANKFAYMGASDGMLLAVRLQDGEVGWHRQVSSSGEIGTPTVAQDIVLAASGISSADATVKALVAVEVESGTEVWRYASPTLAQVFTPAVFNETAYLVGKDGRVVALDLHSGVERWGVDMGQATTALPAIAGGILYVATDEGAVMALTTQDGGHVWTAQLIAGQAYAPVLSAGFMLVGTSHGVLFALGAPTGQ